MGNDERGKIEFFNFYLIFTFTSGCFIYIICLINEANKKNTIRRIAAFKVRLEPEDKVAPL